MANPEHIEILKQGAEVWNQWRKENLGIRPNLVGADLSFTNLRYADFRYADLSTADLSTADLKGADLSGADLSGADLISTNLSDADSSIANFSFANLSNAYLSSANLSSSDFTRADLGSADLCFAVLNRTTLQNVEWGNALLNETILCNVDLSTVKGLETIRHQGPSIVSYETLFNSINKDVPEIFWLGCGVDGETLQHLKDRSWQPIQFESCFISYSHKDEEFAHHLFKRMGTAGLRVWYAPEDMEGGKKLHEQIDQAIQRHDRLLLVLSEHSMNSEWVKTEIYNARQREIKENRRILFPLALMPFSQIREWQFFDGDTGKDLAREIREYFIPDFTDWKNHDIFEATFTRLLRDLKL